MTQKKKNSAIGNRGLGFLLLIPGVLVLILVQFVPMVHTFMMSFQNVDLIGGGSEGVGLENYTRLLEDRSYGSAMVFTLMIVSNRVLTIALIPLIGLLVGQATRGLRVFVRVVLASAAVVVVPMVLPILYQIVELWARSEMDMDPMLSSPEGARSIILLLDGMLTAAVALAVGVPVFMAVLRGRRFGRSAWWVVWLTGIMLALASFPKTFGLVQQLTGGGPASATTTLPLALYRDAFQMFRIGVGAAHGTVMIVSLVILALVIGLFVTLSQMRIRFLPEPVDHGNGAAGVGLVLALLFLLPSVGLVVLGYTVGIAGPESRESVSPIAMAIVNTIAIPWALAWLVGLPLMYLLALGLGYHRTFGRAGSNIVFVVCLMLTIVPPEAIGLSWFIFGRDVGLLDTRFATSIPLHLTSFIVLLLMKLYFDGAREAVEETEGATFGNTVFGQSLLVVIILGVALNLLSMGEIFWSLLAVSSPDVLPMSAFIQRYTIGLGSQFDLLRRMIGLYHGLIAVIFLPVIGILHIAIVDRLGILTGESVDVNMSIEDTAVER